MLEKRLKQILKNIISKGGYDIPYIDTIQIISSDLDKEPKTIVCSVDRGDVSKEQEYKYFGLEAEMEVEFEDFMGIRLTIKGGKGL